MKANRGVLRQPRPDLGVLVGAVVIADDVQRRARVGLRDQAEESQELLVPVARVARIGDLAGGDLQRGEQRGGAVPDVVVAALFGHPGPGWQHRHIIDCLRLARPGPVLQPADPLAGIPALPEDHRRLGHPGPPHDLVRAQPSAASSTILARCARPARIDGKRAHKASTSQSRGGTSTSTVNGMHKP